MDFDVFFWCMSTEAHGTMCINIRTYFLVKQHGILCTDLVMFTRILKYSDAYTRAKGMRFFFWEGLGETQYFSEFQERCVKLLPVAFQYSVTRQRTAYSCMQKHR